jgi:hypothetical protein
MITDLLLDNAALVPLALLVVALLCVGAGWVFLRLPGHGHRALQVAAGVAVLPVLGLTLVPSMKSRDGQLACTVQLALPTLNSVELLANVALFVPSVYFAVLATRRPLAVLAVATGASAAIEAVQGLVPALGRACDTNDWLMNALGTVVAVLLALGTVALHRRTPQKSR